MSNNRGGEDYLDKALDQAEKFAGKKVHNTHLHTYCAPTYKTNKTS
jgi:hypothetical protein